MIGVLFKPMRELSTFSASFFGPYEQVGTFLFLVGRNREYRAPAQVRLKGVVEPEITEAVSGATSEVPSCGLRGVLSLQAKSVEVHESQLISGRLGCPTLVPLSCREAANFPILQRSLSCGDRLAIRPRKTRMRSIGEPSPAYPRLVQVSS